MSHWKHVGFNIRLSPDGDEIEVYEDGVRAISASLWHPIRIWHDGETFRIKIGVAFVIGSEDSE